MYHMLKKNIVGVFLIMAIFSSIGFFYLAEAAGSKNKTRANMVPTHHSETIHFDRGKTELSNSAKMKIQELVSDAKSMGDFKKVEVAVWSDQAFPGQKKELPKADQNIAKKRISAIENYLDQKWKVNAVTYNMAEKTNMLAKLFNTKEQELKSRFGKKDADMPRESFDVFQSDGGPSTAVVVIRTNGSRNIDTDSDY